MRLLSFLILLLLLSNNSFAITIEKVKGNRILIDLDSEEASVGQKINVMNSDGKKVAIATISQIKKGKAIATINKGKASDSDTLELVEMDALDTAAEEEEAPVTKKSTRGVYRLNGMKISGVLTIGTNAMATKQTDGANPTPSTETVQLKGSSTGFTGIIDYPFSSWLTLRGTLGYEPFNAAGTATLVSCNNLTSTDCNVAINYLSTGGYARFDITKSRTMLWVAVGGTFKFPLSKTTTALVADDIKLTMTYGGGAGIDFFINNRSFIPASVEFQMFQSSDTVAATVMLLRIGYGWSF